MKSPHRAARKMALWRKAHAAQANAPANGHIAMLESLPAAVVRVNPTTERITYVNPAGVKLLGTETASKILGKPLIDFVHPEEQEDAKARLTIVTNGNPVDVTERRMVTLGGREITVTAQSIRDQENQVTIALIDTTELVAARRELEEQRRSAALRDVFGSLSSGLNHHLNNLLTPIVGYVFLLSIKIKSIINELELIIQSTRINPKLFDKIMQMLNFAKEKLEIINTNAQEAARIIQALSGFKTQKTETLELAKVLELVRQITANKRLGNPIISFKAETGSETALITGDFATFALDVMKPIVDFLNSNSNEVIQITWAQETVKTTMTMTVPVEIEPEKLAWATDFSVKEPEELAKARSIIVRMNGAISINPNGSDPNKTVIQINF